MKESVCNAHKTHWKWNEVLVFTISTVSFVWKQRMAYHFQEQSLHSLSLQSRKSQSLRVAAGENISPMPAISCPKTENFLHTSVWKCRNFQAFVKKENAWKKCVFENSSYGCGSLVSVVALNRTWQKSHSPGLLTIWVSVIKFLDSSGQESHELLQGRARLLCYFQH